jgi:hypothetical protein
MSRSSNRVNFGTGGFVNPFEGLQSAIGDISKSYLQQEALEREEQRLSRAEAKDQARFDLQQKRLDTQEAWQRQKYDEDKARQEKLDLRQLDKDKMAETLFLQGQEDRKEERLQKSIAKDILAKTNSHTAQSVASDMVDKAVLNTTLAGLQNTPGWTTSAMEGIVTNMQGIKDDTSTPDINERDEALKGLYLSAGGDPSKLNMDDIRYKAAGTVSKEDVLKPAMVEWNRQLANSGLTPERQDAVLKSLVTRFEAANSDLLGRDEQIKAKKAQAEQYKAVADSYRNDLQILNRSDGQVKVGEDGQLLYQGAKVSITEPAWDLDKAMKYGTTREATGDGIGGIITDTGGMNLQEDYNKALPILKDMLKNSGFTDAQASAAISKGLNQTVMNNYIDAKGRNYNDPEALTKAMYSNIMARKEVESNPEYLKNKELIDKGLQAGQAYRESLLAPTPTLNNLVAKLQGNMEVNMGSGRRAQTADNEFSRWEAEDRRFLEEGTKAAREQSRSSNPTTSSPKTQPVGKEALTTITNEGRNALQSYLGDRTGASADTRKQALEAAAQIARDRGVPKPRVDYLVKSNGIELLLKAAEKNSFTDKEEEGISRDVLLQNYGLTIPEPVKVNSTFQVANPQYFTPRPVSRGIVVGRE